MTNNKGDVQHKSLKVWGVRRKEPDLTALAFAYYLLARQRIEAQRAQESAGDEQEAA